MMKLPKRLAHWQAAVKLKPAVVLTSPELYRWDSELLGRIIL